MLRLALALALVAALIGGARAETAARRMLNDAQARAFGFVGRLNVAGSRFCTATLISERHVVTAARCLFHPRTHERVALAEIRFVAGWRLGEYVALRGVTRAAVPQGFVFDGRPNFEAMQLDLAVLELEAPVGTDAAVPAVTGPPPRPGARVAIVSYARERAQAASIQENCAVRLVVGSLAALGCPTNFGASGAPVFARLAGENRLIAVVSAIGRILDGGEVSFAAVAEPQLSFLLAELEAPGQATEAAVGRPMPRP